ncbi:unnamed protein product [Prunus armeniaca]
MADVRPPNDHVSYPEDHPWHVPFPCPPLTLNHDSTSSRSESESNDPLNKISAMKLDLYLARPVQNQKSHVKFWQPPQFTLSSWAKTRYAKPTFY